MPPYRLEVEPYSAHDHILRLVGRDVRVLDVGCASGYLARRFAANGCEVAGIETDADSARRAAEAGVDVAVLDLERAESYPFPAGAFDVVVLGDVLEHLADPVPVVRRLARHLAPGGRFVVSLPNVSNWSVRLHLLRGRWEYQDLGILDRTHLRFYTRETARRLLEEGGLRVASEDVTPNLPVPFYARSRLVRDARQALTRAFPGLFAFQFVFVAVPAEAGRLSVDAPQASTQGQEATTTTG